jgi:serine/threonine protein kinase
MLQPDMILGAYRLIGPLGAGGMGEVWKAEDTRLGRIVAIKFLPPAVAADPDAMGRMRREARTAAQLNHPNIATIHAFEEGGERLFIVMELVEGESLTEILRRGPLPEPEVTRIGRNIAEALAEAHAKDIVHRDIKPDNVIVNGQRVKVLDFGIAKRVGAEPVGSDDATAFRTQSGVIIGTVTFMSPEQALGRAVDARTDIFSLGVLLYQAAAGRLPFSGQSPTETIMHIVRDEPASLRGVVSPQLEAIIRRCLQKDPADRFASARELADALDRQFGSAATVVTGAHEAPRRWPVIAAMSAMVIVIALAAIVMSRPRVKQATPAREAKQTASPTVISTTVEVSAAAAPASDPASEPTTTAVVIEPAEKPATNVKRAEDLYNDGLARLGERQPFRAKDAFENAVALDPQHGKAHFRLGQIALFGRDFPLARHELHAALENVDRLEPRERKLTELGLAVLDRDPERARAIVEELEAVSPRDPDLLRFRQLVDGVQGARGHGRRRNQ